MLIWKCLHIHRERALRAHQKTCACASRPQGRNRESDTREYMHKRPAHQTRQCAACSARHNRRSRNGRDCGTDRKLGEQSQARRQGSSKCRDLLRRMLLLQTRICEQLYRSRRRLGTWLQDRWRTGATGYWAAKISEIGKEDTVLIIGAGPTGICSLLCTMLKKPERIIVCEKDPVRADFVKKHYPSVLVTGPEDCREFTLANSAHGGADVVMEVAGSDGSFRLAWECARPNATVTIVALYDRPQILPLPEMYGKNLVFKTGGVDGCDCDEILRLISEGKIDTTPLITHRIPLSHIEEGYRIFENREDGVIKVAVTV